MAQYPSELQLSSALAANWGSQFVDAQGFSHVYIMAYSAASFSLYIDWSQDAGRTADYQDSLVAVTGGQVISLPVRSRWFAISVAISAPPQTCRLSCSLNGDSLGLSILDNAGAGAQILDKSVHKVRSLTSVDGSVTIQELATTIDLAVSALVTPVSLSSAGGTYSLVSDGVGPALGVKGISAGTGVSIADSGAALTVTNTAPDQTVTLTAGTGISATGVYPNFTITNTSPASGIQLVSEGYTSLVSETLYFGDTLGIKGLANGTGISFTDLIVGGYKIGVQINNTSLNTDVSLSSAGGTISLVNDGVGPALAVKGIQGGTGITISDAGTYISVVNSAPDQTVTLTAGSNVTVTGSYPNFTIAASGGSSSQKMFFNSVMIPPALGGIVYFSEAWTGTGVICPYKPLVNETITSFSFNSEENGYLNQPTDLTGGALDIYIFTFPNDTNVSSVGSLTLLPAGPHYSLPYTEINSATKNYRYYTHTKDMSLTAGTIYGFYLQDNLTDTASRFTAYSVTLKWTIRPT